MMDAATPSINHGSNFSTTAANTFAAAAHDDLAGVIRMGAGVSRHATKMAWGGVSDRHIPPYRNGEDWLRIQDTAALIGMGAMPWEPSGRCVFL